MSANESGIPVAELGTALVQTGIITESQWAQALSRAGGEANLPVALDILTRTPAAWAPTEGVGGIRSTALSKHQIKQIDRCLKENAIPKLARALRWNNYFIIDPIGKGGMGVVYKGWDVEAKRYVAIKRTHRDSAEVRKRLKREAKLQLALDHPNIAKLFALVKYGQTDLLVMEYLQGNTLSELIHKRGRDKPLPWQFVAEMAAAILEALDHAHGNNQRGVTVVHRDIKPGNIMLMRHKEGKVDKYIPKLLDMGLAKSIGGTEAGPDQVSVDEQLTRQFQILGTPEYMAPEQWEGGLAALPESDTYCLGGTLFYALTGEAPFTGVNKGNKMTYFAEMCHKHSSDPRPSVRAKRPDVPIEIDRLLQQMMAVAPSHRGKSLWLRDQFLGLLASPPAPVSARSGPPSSGNRTVNMPTPHGGIATTPSASDAPSIFQFAAEELSGPSSSVHPGGPRTNSPDSSPRLGPPPRAIDDFDDGDVKVISKGYAPDDDDEDEDDDEGHPRISQRRAVDAIGEKAKQFLDPSKKGERLREATFESILGWLRGLTRPDRNPFSLVAVIIGLALIAWFVAWGLAAFFAGVIVLAIGFAFAAQGYDSD